MNPANVETLWPRMLSKLCEQAVPMTLGSHRLKLLADLPQADETVWRNLSVSRASAERLIDFWLHHLLWQVYRQTSQIDEQQGRGKSIWRFKEASNQLKPIGLAEQSIYELQPMQADKAAKLLQNFIIFMLLGSKLPITLTPMNALLMAKGQDVADISDDWVDGVYALIIGTSSPQQALSAAGQLIIPLYDELLNNVQAFNIQAFNQDER